MQQAIYNNTAIPTTQPQTTQPQTTQPQTSRTATPPPALQTAGVLRWVARKWDLVGVLALLGASAAYGVFALAHVGL